MADTVSSFQDLSKLRPGIAAEPEVKLWDLAPLELLVREAGGVFTAVDGTPGPHGGSAVASNGLLHQDALRYLTPE